MNEKSSTTDKLLHLIATTTVDELDCDGCLELLPLYAEFALASANPDAPDTVPETLICVQVHLHQCECCQEEYEIIVACLKLVGA